MWVPFKVTLKDILKKKMLEAGEKGCYEECDQCGRLFLQRNFEKLCWSCEIEEEQKKKGITSKHSNTGSNSK